MRHGLSRSHRLGTHPLEIQVDLGLGLNRRELLGELERQRGLADAAHASDAGDGHAPALDSGSQLREIRLAAGEVSGWGRELVEDRDLEGGPVPR